MLSPDGRSKPGQPVDALTVRPPSRAISPSDLTPGGGGSVDPALLAEMERIAHERRAASPRVQAVWHGVTDLAPDRSIGAVEAILPEVRLRRDHVRALGGRLSADGAEPPAGGSMASLRACVALETLVLSMQVERLEGAGHQLRRLARDVGIAVEVSLAMARWFSEARYSPGLVGSVRPALEATERAFRRLASAPGIDHRELELVLGSYHALVMQCTVAPLRPGATHFGQGEIFRLLEDVATLPGERGAALLAVARATWLIQAEKTPADSPVVVQLDHALDRLARDVPGAGAWLAAYGELLHAALARTSGARPGASSGSPAATRDP